MDMDSGRILYGKDINYTQSVASISKIMTAISVIEKVDINREITVGDEVELVIDKDRRKHIECNHSSVHIIQYALQQVVSGSIHQAGSYVDDERLRFDFNLDHKMTPEEIAELEAFVNDVIAKDIEVTCKEMPLDEARAMGAHGIFDSKYGDKVKIYIIGDVDKQICGGPHAKTTGDLHHFKITKEESSSSGIRRIKAILD